jgi:cyanophycin synthetase
MKVMNIKVMRGPNYWSNYRRQLIVMKLDIEQYEELPTNKLPGFCNRLMRLLPTLEEHRCSEGTKGGLYKRMQEGTWLGHVIEHVALELQCLAGMDCGFGRTRSAGAYGVYKVVFSYQLESAGRYAAKAAVELVTAVAEKRPYNLKKTLHDLAQICKNEALGPSTQAIVDEAVSRGIPYRRLDSDSLVMLGQGAKQQVFRATVLGTTSSIAVDTASCKWSTKNILEANGIPVPKGVTIESRSELEAAVKEVGFPLVIKPIDGNHGRGITANIQSSEAAVKALSTARKVSDTVIVESYITGDDYRFLVIGYKLVAVAKRTPAKVTGNGFSTIKQLIDTVNASPERGTGHEKRLTKIRIDSQTKLLLKEAGLSPEDILPQGKELLLKRTANLSTGGTSTDVTDSVHPANVFIAERVARLMGLDVCGIDVMAQDVSIPLSVKGNGAIIEVNAGPGFRMHTHPSHGQPRNVAGPVVDLLFPDNSNGRIPVVAVTGTNGKTTTTRLIAHIAAQAGMSVGYTTTEGIYINNRMITEGDCSGPKSAELILKDPSVDYAVLECARGGILRSGLAFDKCDISIVTNVTEDHMGLDDVTDLDDYARVKEVVPRSTFDSGHAILNADNDYTYAMKQNMRCKVVLFSRRSFNPRITDHCEEGGMAVIIENGHYVMCDGLKKTRIIAVNKVPLTFEGTAGFMVENILPAIGAAFLSGFSMETIQQALLSFIPSPEMTPGRLNRFEFDQFSVMLDYVHNEAGLIEVERFMSKVKASHKLCIIGATGDRRDEDIRKLGYYAARMFDEIIIRHDKDGRGRSNEEMTALLKEGITGVDPKKQVHVISDEKEAICFAVEHAREGSLVFICADQVLESIAMIRELQQQRVKSFSLQAS